jgi:hypothetical protein
MVIEKRMSIVLLLGAALCFGGSAWAQSSWSTQPQASQPAASGVKPLSGTLNLQFQGQTTGACPTGGYADYCGSLNCVCDVFTGTVQSSATGRGTAELDLTLEQGGIYPVGYSSNLCYPAYYEVYIVGKKDSQDWDANATGCDLLNNKHPIESGFGLHDSLTYSGGVGVATGNLKNNKLIVKFKGNVVQ